MNKLTYSALITATALTCFLPGVARAQTSPAADGSGLADIVVTATKSGKTSLQSTPLAVSAFSGEDLSLTGTSSVADLARYTPSLKVGEVTASPSIYIRGIGTNNVFNGSDPNVAMVLDGVYLARAFQQYSDFFDVDRVEVLRGPQGTTFGRNAVGGVINIVSRKPSDEFEGRAKLTVGNYHLIRTEAYLSGPLVPGVLSASIAGNYENHRPYNRNIVPGQKGVASADRGGVRMQLRWTPNDMIDATTRFDYNRASQAMQSYDHILVPYPAFFSPFFDLANSTIGKSHTVALDVPGHIKNKGWGIAEDVNIDFSDDVSLRSVTAYRDSLYNLSLDADASEVSAAQIFQAERAKQFSQEFNLVGNFKNFDGVLGLYYIDEHNVSDNSAIIYPPFDGVLNVIAPDLRADSKAAFAQGSYHLPGGFSINLGGRYTKDTKKFDQIYSSFDFSDPPTVGAQLPGFPFDPPRIKRSWDDFSIKAGLDWQATRDIFAYLTYSEGFKSGGFNYAALNTSGISFDPERLKSYELGLKTQWLDRRLRLNVTGFYYDYSGLQVQQSLSPGNVQITNAATARVKGIEGELAVQLSPRLTLSANATYLDAKYRRFPTASVPDALVPFVEDDPRFTPGDDDLEDSGLFNASGNRMNNAPKLAYTISAKYTQPIGDAEAYLTADYYHQSATQFDASNASILREPRYGLVNLGVGFNSSDKLWNVQLLAKNLLKEDYFVVRAANGLVPSAPSGAPRTVMLSVMRSF